MRPSRKQDLVDTAERLFDEHGFTATGVDVIIETAGTAKMTLYNNFGSKDALVAETIRQRGDRFAKRFDDWAARVEGSGRDKLLSLFDALEAWFREEDFRGCYFMKLAAEYPDAASAARKAALAHKAATLASIRTLAEHAGARSPVDLAGQLFLLMEGATTVAHQTGDVSAAPRARAAAEVLIDAALS